MADESAAKSSGSDLVPIAVDGLRKSSDPDVQNKESTYSQGSHAETILVPKDAPLSALWARIKSLGFDSPDSLRHGEKRWRDNDMKLCTHPFAELEVVEDRPSEVGKCINIHDPLIAFANRELKKDINLDISKNDLTDYGTSIESLKDDGGLDISFHRTTRMPDDDKIHQLPGSLGAFPIYNVNAYHDQLPENISEQGGVFLPMWQREALWISFSAPYAREYALRVFVGRINAVSGLKMDEGGDESRAMDEVQDYVVVPGQEWLDGICIASGIVRQFVAMPLGSGYTVEGQKTGKERFGGLQIEIIPSYQRRLKTWSREPTEPSSTNVPYNRLITLDELKTPWDLSLKPGAKIRSHPPDPTYLAPYVMSDLAGSFPEEGIHISALYQKPVGRRNTASGLREPIACPESRSMPPYHSSIPSDYNSIPPDRSNIPPGRSSMCGSSPQSGEQNRSTNNGTMEDNSSAKIAPKNLKAMGLGAGGKLVQDIYQDSNPARIWNTAATRLVHVHILDPASCERVTHVIPPPPPIDAMGYVEANMPFFVVEEQVDNRVEGGDFNNVMSVSTMDKEKGVEAEPSFDPLKPKMCKQCETRLCDCIVRPCAHAFCNVCIKKLDDGQEASSQQVQQWNCPTCGSGVSHVAGFSAPMNLPGEEALKVKVPVHVLKVEDGRVQFKSVQRTRI